MFQFPEEQLDSSVGYFAAQLGQALQNNRWSIIRKLGWGPRSSTWLAVDSKDPDDITAVKIFTAAATADSYASNELDMLRGPLNQPTLPFPSIRGHFYEQSSKGKHLCLALNVLGPSVESFRRSSSNGAYLPLLVVKKIVADVVEALCELQKSQVIHGAVNLDNLLFVSAQQAPDIRRVISASPTNQAEQILGSDGALYYAIRSQPIEHGFNWNDSRETFAEASISLSNFGYARFSHQPPISSSAPGMVLAPETLQGGKVDQKSDIWGLGIMTYLLLTGTPLFTASTLNDNYKETIANLEQLLISSNNKLSVLDIPPTFAFLKSCLEIDPADRASADDLIGSDWVQEGQVCSCGVVCQGVVTCL